MDANDFRPWLEKASVQPSVLACAVKSDQSTSVVTADPSFPDKRIRDLLQTLSEVGLSLRKDHITGGRWRWIFENAQIHSARHSDGALALLIMANVPNAAPVADHALREFVSVAPALEAPPADAAAPDGAPPDDAATDSAPSEPPPLEAPPSEVTPEIVAEPPLVNGIENGEFQHN
jgi:hypothetical protein